MKRAMWLAVLAVLLVAGSALADDGLVGSGGRSESGGGSMGSGTNAAEDPRIGGYVGSDGRTEEVWIIEHEDGTLTVLAFSPLLGGGGLRITTQEDGGILGSGGRSGLMGSGG